MLEDVKKSFFQVDNERKLYLGKFLLISVLLLFRCFRNDSSDPSAADEKNKPCIKLPPWRRR